MLPVAVIGNSEVTRSKEVRALTLYPTPSGMATRMDGETSGSPGQPCQASKIRTVSQLVDSGGAAFMQLDYFPQTLFADVLQ